MAIGGHMASGSMITFLSYSYLCFKINVADKANYSCLMFRGSWLDYSDEFGGW